MTARIIMLSAVATLGGCATATQIQSSWTDPTFSGTPFDRVAVVALFDSTAESRTFEQSAASALEERGIDALPAFTIVSEERMYEEAELREQLADADVDGILIYRLIAVDERNVYRNPTPYMQVPGGIMFGDPYYWYYYPRWNYYWHWRSTWDVTRSPGYWEPLVYVIVESSLYDARKDRLVWTAKSATIDNSQFKTLADSIVTRVTRELIDANIVAGRDAGRTAALR
jgi:hypothetical protein